MVVRQAIFGGEGDKLGSIIPSYTPTRTKPQIPLSIRHNAIYSASRETIQDRETLPQPLPEARTVVPVPAGAV